MSSINMIRFNILINKWRDPKNTSDVTKLNRLADETMQAINSDPFLKNVCEIFMYSVYAKAVNDPSFKNMQGFPGGAK